MEKENEKDVKSTYNHIEVDTTEVKDVNELVENSCKKKRGRPKKFMPYDKETESSCSRKVISNDKNRKANEKETKKAYNEVEENAADLKDIHELAENSCKKKRGRPKKSVLYDKKNESTSLREVISNDKKRKENEKETKNYNETEECVAKLKDFDELIENHYKKNKDHSKKSIPDVKKTEIKVLKDNEERRENDKETRSPDNAIERCTAELKTDDKGVDYFDELVITNCKKRRGSPKMSAPAIIKIESSQSKKVVTQDIKIWKECDQQLKWNTKDIEENWSKIEDNVKEMKENDKQMGENTEVIQRSDTDKEVKHNMEENNKEKRSASMKTVTPNAKNAKQSNTTKRRKRNPKKLTQNIKELKQNKYMEQLEENSEKMKVVYQASVMYKTDDDIEDSSHSSDMLDSDDAEVNSDYFKGFNESEPKSRVRYDNRKNERIFTCHICNGDEKMTKKETWAHNKKWHSRQHFGFLKFHKDCRARCELCSEELMMDKDVKPHLESHSNELFCEICYKFSKNVAEYILHLEEHNSGKFNCVLCEFKTDSVADITRHLKSLHSDNLEYKCEKCGKGFYNIKWLSHHTKNYHYSHRPYKCKYCSKQFSYSHYLSAHNIMMHKEEVNKVQRFYKCVICKTQYQNRCSLFLHMNIHKGNICVCDICGMNLSSLESLKFHMRTHTGFKPFTCYNCGKSFARKTNLIEHVRIHTGEKPYTCTICSKGFSQRSSLVIHIRQHTGEKPFVCHICNKGFAARALLNVHIKNGKCVVE